jgi:single-strand DNA-binding protein
MARKSLNKVILLGNLGKDPEVRYTASGKAMATFSLATSFQWRDPEGNDQERTEWHRIVAWGRLGEICGEYLSKGKQVFIEGRIQSREWEDQEGNKRTTVEIVATDMILLGGGAGQNRESRDYEDRPAKKQPPQRARAGGEAPKRSETTRYEPPPPEDEIPF